MSKAPVDPNSGQYLRFIGLDRGLHPDFGGEAPNPPEIYGLPFVTVPGDQPLVPVAFVAYPGESDAGAPGRPPGYPIPDQAITQPKWIEGGQPGSSAVGGDRHLLIVDRDHKILFELYQAHWNGEKDLWEASSGAVFPLTSNLRRPEGWTSADASGLAILPGLVRYDEVHGNTPIRHAFRCSVGATNGHVFPASHSAGSTVGALPLGARLRLKASVDISSFSPPVRRIFQAMKTYGLIVADNGSDLYVQGTYDPRWDNDVLNPAFAALKASDFEVIKLGWKPATTSSPGPCVSSQTTLCLGHGRFALSARWKTSEGQTGEAHAVSLGQESGYFWFFRSANLELVVKVHNACSAFGRYWVFVSALTNAGVDLTVMDTKTGETRDYTNPTGTRFSPIYDTDAFSGCP
ncbi:MAG TPA: hypothetical protein VKA53_07485 [Thermoanaerobaculia bacterium]|nr:hypothetical protein [Thermoanaerobaculia bacterium]